MNGGRLRILAFVLLLACACGMKAAPQPREMVVPERIGALAGEFTPEGVQLTFTLPARSLDGSNLSRIGGYRIVREGPTEGEELREEEVRFSVTEQKEQVGKEVKFLDDPLPAGGGEGIYRYVVFPLDTYGSHPEGTAVILRWEGRLSPAGHVR